ncbi:unnamed protein product [Lactuca virosa]|uniref:Gnk2-homologous domain-containing protein n=1 Tax=Lactuca virosa TaxID=75947 RepID=A0AAU9PDX0_9ASTR|nr:unnamed protein product [Lactuca virosa]
MKSIISIVFLLQTIINAVNLTTAQFPEEPVFRCRNTGNYTPSSDYSRNLKAALDAVGKVKKYSGGSFSSSIGTKEAAYAVALCSSVAIKWGGNCNDCITRLTTSLQAKCPNQKEGVMWGSDCMIRYSDRKIIGVKDDWVWILSPGGSSRTDKKAAFGTITFPPNNSTIYGAMQCTSDLSKELCTKCLQNDMCRSQSIDFICTTTVFCFSVDLSTKNYPSGDSPLPSTSCPSPPSASTSPSSDLIPMYIVGPSPPLISPVILR